MDRVAAALAALEVPIVDDADAALRRRGASHYDERDARGKLLALFRQVLDSIDAHDPDRVAAYSEGIARERLRGGFSISEVQAAFSALEEAMWARAITALEGDERTVGVEAISSALGAGRDALARAYVAGALSPGRPGAPDGTGEPPVSTDVVGAIGVVTMHDQAKLNALGARMADHIVAALETLRAQGARAVVLRAAPGMRVWSSGHDIGASPRSPGPPRLQRPAGAVHAGGAQPPSADRGDDPGLGLGRRL